MISGILPRSLEPVPLPTGILTSLTVDDEMRSGSGTSLTVELVTEAFDVVEGVED